MKKYVLMTVGFTDPTPDVMGPWVEWFKSIEDRTVEQVGLSDGRYVGEDGVTELQMDAEAITGYLVIEAEDIDDAVRIAESCPAVTGTRVYELHG